MADIALIGGETLLGREVRDVFAETSLGDRLRLVAADEKESGKIAEIGGAAAFLARLNSDSVEDVRVLLLVGSGKASREAIQANPSALVVDLTFETEDDPDARVRAPLFEAGNAEDGPYDSGVAGPQVVAHSAAVAIAMALDRLHRNFPIAAAVANVFEPASAMGTAGIEELQQQTLNLLSFKPMPKKVFDAQLSFAMLPQLGEDAEAKLAETEERIERHLATLLSRCATERGDAEQSPPMPSLRLIQAPVFHGYSVSLWVLFEDAPSPAEVEEALSGDPFDVRGEGVEAPNNVGIAGQGGVAAGAITPDRNNGNAMWLWLAADNLRLAAENAAMIVRELA